jgi:hypothetical protein
VAAWAWMGRLGPLPLALLCCSVVAFGIEKAVDGSWWWAALALVTALAFATSGFLAVREHARTRAGRKSP